MVPPITHHFGYSHPILADEILQSVQRLATLDGPKFEYQWGGGDIFRTHPGARLVFHTVCTRLRHDVDHPLPFGVEAECGSSYTLLGMLWYSLSVFTKNHTRQLQFQYQPLSGSLAINGGSTLCCFPLHYTASLF